MTEGRKHFTAETIAALHRYKQAGIIAGAGRSHFTTIWPVEVHGRLFARSYGLAERSWYTAFLQEPEGLLKISDETLAIRGIVPPDSLVLAEAISRAYAAAYPSVRHRTLIKNVAKPERVARTIEFVLR